MFDIRYILIIILLGIIIYLIYNLYSYQSNKVDKLKENISEKIDMEFEDINERMDELEQLIEKRLNDSNKKIYVYDPKRFKKGKDIFFENYEKDSNIQKDGNDYIIKKYILFNYVHLDFLGKIESD